MTRDAVSAQRPIATCGQIQGRDSGNAATGFLTAGNPTATLGPPLRLTEIVAWGMTCPRCRAQNDDGARFCEDCGARLEAACPRCGFAVSDGPARS